MPVPRSELAEAIDRRLFRRTARTAGERAKRVSTLANTLQRSVQLARGILAGRRELTEDHLAALEAQEIDGKPLLSEAAREKIREAEGARDKRATGRPLSPNTVQLTLSRTETIAREHADPETADRVQALRLRLAKQPPTTAPSPRI